MLSSSAPGWRCVPVDALAWREWDGETVVRNERTGSTHLLGPLAARVLQLLLEADGGLSVGDLLSRLDASLTSGALEPSAAVEEVLTEFRRLGLAAPDAQ